jgi:hypothetical protein
MFTSTELKAQLRKDMNVTSYELIGLIKHHTMKAYGEVLYRSTFSWLRHELEVSGQLHAPAALPPGKELPVPIG